jgi:hypothetical protein
MWVIDFWEVTDIKKDNRCIILLSREINDLWSKNEQSINKLSIQAGYWKWYYESDQEGKNKIICFKYIITLENKNKIMYIIKIKSYIN